MWVSESPISKPLMPVSDGTPSLVSGDFESPILDFVSSLGLDFWNWGLAVSQSPKFTILYASFWLANSFVVDCTQEACSLFTKSKHSFKTFN